MKNEEHLFKKIAKRLDFLAELPACKEDKNLDAELSKKGIDRRDFMKWAGAMTATLALPAAFAPLTARAAEVANRLPVIWLHMAECTGCSESLLRTEDPSIDSIIFDTINLEYHETIMAAAGYQAEENLENAIKKHKGNYILMVEGGIPTVEYFLTIGAHGRTGAQACRDAAEGAAAIFAIGTCSSFGGVQAAAPNPTSAAPLHKIITKPIINVPGCPPSEKNIVGNVLYFVMFGTLPAVDAFNRPKWAYGNRIHDLCERRGHFDAGEFVRSFGDENAQRGFCLYKMGCKGPYTFNNCSKLRFNSHTSWPIQAGHGCIGCSEPNFWDTMSPFEEPIGNRLFHTGFDGIGADRTADNVGTVIFTAVGIGIAAHAIISTMTKSK
ncbi:hydrogenase small subunit [Helicobacter mustelae]|uniref:Ni/Fe-hydrogenase small chain n=1 Tax=Helicobacter mustelae (strain ATCC 43772 / CCUG 25715 / CIP 103759 / LMG 18044 / NCTC 12198 / R85-136P) TaxID=679897 RepID=D3UIC5_HELM1|nr:hydrogenase small subunit [Helicobacter mustelae]CBG40248.1 Ni/Fe-hydrogenase small chain [Helicobacter mustelae 12198]SQH71747.1 Ni/Fe-hydrogenase small chain [Helicobacter mustelae]STP12876.1 Ni/Fe-hydrogenase small chain [Helicobacter mustelae]